MYIKVLACEYADTVCLNLTHRTESKIVNIAWNCEESKMIRTALIVNVTIKTIETISAFCWHSVMVLESSLC